MGSQEPSERIAPEYRATDGPDAVRILRAGGTVLDPWQSDILDDWMGRTVSGKWTAPTAGGSVPRQNGKSLLVQAGGVRHAHVQRNGHLHGPPAKDRHRDL